MSYLRYLCIFGHSGVQRILCCFFLRLVSQSRLSLQYSLTFIYNYNIAHGLEQPMTYCTMCKQGRIYRTNEALH
jgi:hypothetical protein